MANAFSQKQNAMAISEGSPFKSLSPRAMERMNRIAQQVAREKAVEQRYGFSDFAGLEQPWIDPIETATGGLMAIPRGIASVGLDMALDPLIGFGLERAFEGDSAALPAMLAGKRGIKKLGVNPERTLVSQVGEVVDGLRVDKDIPNTKSISATFDDWDEGGVQVLDMADFDSSPYDMFYAKNDIDRSNVLAKEIKQNKYIKPLIVVEDAEGKYVLEGGHRLAALDILGKKQFPALVIREK